MFHVLCMIMYLKATASLQRKNPSSEAKDEKRKILISIENHVMAIHIKNYFLLIQPLYWLAGKREQQSILN